MTWRAPTFAAAAFTGWLAVGCCAWAQQTAVPPSDPNVTDSPAVLPANTSEARAVPINEERILKVIPDYQTVRDSSRPVAPLTAKQKWNLAWRETVDPFNIGSAAFTALTSQIANQTPKYGKSWTNYGPRFGAAVADFGTQNFFTAGVFANLLHQDPRYFRKGVNSRFLPRVLYSVSRLAMCRNDGGRTVLNASNFLGMSFGIAASNVYYPSSSRTGSVMGGRVETSVFGGVMGNLMSEFWPDIQHKFFQKKAKK
ncbi:MAG TPA: hypothetical protein VHW24_17735 [Bryobacteraceae bacterium]|nr:hypothetical protein [Bryobacteraceae bacterium]